MGSTTLSGPVAVNEERLEGAARNLVVEKTGAERGLFRACGSATQGL